MNENNAIKYIRSAEAGSFKHTSEHTKALLKALGEPLEKIKIIKIYGEVGKSLLALRLSHLLSAAGFRVGILSLSHPETASRESILADGTPISASRFAEAVSEVAAVLASEGAASSEELLLASGLLALQKENCRFVLLEISALPHSAATALSFPLLNVITHTENEETANAICTLMDKESDETVTCVQSAAIMKRLTDRCAQVNCRITFPIVQNSLYIMEHTLGKIRFFYNKKEYFLSGSSKCELNAALCLIECYHALIRRGVRLPSAALPKALAAMPCKRSFHVFSMSPPILIDAADTPLRLRSLLDTLTFQKDIVGTTFDIWTVQKTSEIIQTAFAPFALRSVTFIDEKNLYRSVKLAFRAYDRKATLLILGDADLVCEIERTLRNLI